MPTVRGFGLLLAGVGLLIGGRMFGLPELLYIGTAAFVAVVLACLAVSLGRARVGVARDLAPARAHAGEQVQVHLEIRNRAPLPTSILEVTDTIEGLPRPAMFTSPAIPPGKTASAGYALTCRSRGIYRVGPLTIGVADPFGLARLTRRIDLRADLAVYPQCIPLSPLPPASGNDIGNRTDRPSLQTPHGEEFFTLREYQVGDDLKKVHWRSTARRGRLMIRQEEVPWHARGTVVLDVRQVALGASGSPPFEAAVIAAASAVQHHADRGEFCRFVATDGSELPFGYGLDHFRAVLDRLAVIEDTSEDRLASTLAQLRRGESGGALVFCGGVLAEDEARRLASLRSRYGPVVAVRYPVSAASGNLGREREAEREGGVDGILRSGGVIVVRPGGEGLAAAWDRVVGMARRADADGTVASRRARVVR